MQMNICKVYFGLLEASTHRKLQTRAPLTTWGISSTSLFPLESQTPSDGRFGSRFGARWGGMG